MTPAGGTRRQLIGAGLAAVTASFARLGYAAASAGHSLRPNQSVYLGQAAVTGDLNDTARRFGLHRAGPQARNYCLRLVWAPSRGTALYLGANHGQPHRLNDVWEFDLRALRWTLLYGPDLPRDYKGLGPDASDVLYRDGRLITRRGGPAIIGHTWSGVTWDPNRERVVFMNAWPADVDAAIRRVGGDPGLRDRSLPLWTFDPARREWAPLRIGHPAPRAGFGGLLQHIPALDGCLWHLNNWQMRGTWLLQGNDRWRDLDATGGTEPFATQAPGAEVVACYDGRSGCLVARQGRSTFEFDPHRRLWQRLDDSPSGPPVPAGHAARTSMVFDEASGHVVLFDVPSRKLWSRSPAQKQWRVIDPEGPPPPSGQRPLFWTDPVSGIMLVVVDTLVWAYRHY